AEGGYTLSLSATDNMGNQTSKDVEFTIDRSSPEVMIRIKPKIFMKNDTVCVSHNGSISFDYIDVTDTDIYYKIEFEQQRFGIWQQYLDTIQLSDYCDNIDAYYKGTDKCGNASAEYSRILYVNHKIPETYILYCHYYEDAGVIYLSPESYITLESESTYVGTKGIYYKTTNQKNGFNEYTEPFKLTNTGFNDVYFYSINNLDEREGINNRAFYYDNITPSLDVNFIGYHQHSSDQTTIDTSTVIEFNTEETGSGIKDVLYQIGDTMCNYSTPFKIQEKGYYNLITYINDNVGNIAIDTINLFVDEKTIEAEFYFEGSNYGQFVTGESKIGITVTDSGVGVSDILYSMDSCDYTAYSTPIDLYGMEEGSHCIKTLAIDSNNNSFTDSMLFTIDNSAPLISVIEEGVGY
ncbi:hypothetical protein KAU43_02810, partial [candidate division WOR-3 bacterium]|nr:hypothetical protein [candidate division WOR-3 bacterium]